MEVLHEPQLNTVLMVEKAILDAEDYPTRTELWKNLPRKVQYQTFKRILEYLRMTYCFSNPLSPQKDVVTART
jgi:hypothetical protein